MLKKYGQFFDDLAKKTWENQSTLEYTAEAPIKLVYRAEEDASIASLVEMENTNFSKILAAVGGTCREIRLLKKESKDHYVKLFMHGESSENENSFEKVDQLVADLQDLSVYVNRLFTVLHLSVEQLANLSNGSQDIYLPALIELTTDLYIILVSLDEIVEAHPSITERWKQYRIHLRSVIHNPKQIDIPGSKLLTFEKLLKDLHSQLLSRSLFANSIEHVMNVNKTNTMSDHVSSYLKNIVTDLESKYPDQCALSKNWLRANVGVVVLSRLFGNQPSTKKLIKRITEINKRNYAVTLAGNVLWIPGKFLAEHFPKDVGNNLVTSQMGEKILVNRVQRLPQVVNSLIHRAMIWCLETQSIFVRADLNLADIEKKRSLLAEIQALTMEIGENVSFITNMHASLSKPMNKSSVQLICRLIEVQRSVEMTFNNLAAVILQSQVQVIQHLNYQILMILDNARKSLIQKDKGYSRERLDALSLLNLSMRLISGCGTEDRRLLVRCSLACATQLSESFKEDEVLKLRNYLEGYEAMVELHDRLSETCDYSVLLHHQTIVPAYFNLVNGGNLDVSHLAHLLSAFNGLVEEQGYTEMTEAKMQELRQLLVKRILEPACREIETSLRLHVHADLKLDSGNPFSKSVENGNRVAQASSLAIKQSLISPKRFIEHYLDDMFYNLTTVALHDWKTYRSMHALANYKLGLESVQNHLPTQTLEQGLDALEIMRNIHVFVSKYHYNLNTQTFIEHTSANKHLNTIGIRHIANSIRTHGTGIMSTTVNLVYQFLRVKLHTFSQFLFDELIKSRLTRDTRFIKSQREKGESPYTYQRAEEFQKGIRKLGMTADGLSYLDQCRQLIAQIGNALGYVRLIRSGGLHASSKSVSFLPDINTPTSFESICKDLEYTETTQAAAKCLEDDIANLVRNFTEGIHYFKLLVDVFAPAFRDEKLHHLQQFYALVPPLTLSFVDNALSNKEKIFKKNQIGAAFTDDGFAMGLAYINALLNQSADLDGLQWFKTIDQHIESEKNAIASKNDQGDEKLSQTRALTLKRLSERSAEFRSLYYSLSGARVFFKQADT